MAKMTEIDLKALVDAEMRQAVGFWGGELSAARLKAEQYYLGLPEGDLLPPDVEGRSSVVSTDVRNTIEAMLPQLMVKFTGGDTVVEFEPSQRDDEQKAKLCTDYLNYLFFKKNNGHNVTYAWFKDALIQKIGIVKCWWDTRNEETKEEYRGLSPVELAQLLDDPEIEPKEHSEYPDEDDAKQRQQAIQQLTQQLQQAMQQPAAPGGAPPAAQSPGMANAPQQSPAPVNPAVQQIQQQLAQIQAQPPAMLHDVTVERVKQGGKMAIENVPPEEFLIARRAKCIADASFVGHRVRRTMSELKSMGYKGLDRLGSDHDDGRDEYRMRDRVDGVYDHDDDTSTDPSQRRVWVSELYMRVDYDGDGIAELRKIVYVGGEILDNDVVDIVPLVSVCPVPMPHKFFGLSIADLAMEAQKTKTGILRAQLDNMYLQVNGRYFAVDGQVNLDDLLVSRPGGVVRIKSPGMVGRLDQAMGDAAAGMGMLEYMEGYLETSTGWTRYSQGNDAKDLQGTATGMNIVTNKDDMRLDLIARNFAEGFTDLFKLMLKLVCQHQDKRIEARIGGQWVDVDPREWRNQFDVEINIGLGVGNKDQKIAHLQALLQQQSLVYPLGVSDAKSVYEASVEMAKLQGFKNGDKFFVDVSKQPPKPPAPDPEATKAQAQMQLEQMRQQGAQQIAQMELQAAGQAEQQKAQVTMQVERDKMELQARVDQNRQQQEAGQQQLKMQAEAELNRYKAELDAQKEQAKAQTQMQIEQQRIDSAERIAQMTEQNKMAIAQLGHQASLQQIGMQAATRPPEQPKEGQAAPKDDGKVSETVAALQQQLAEMQRQRSAPIKFIRGKDGRAEGFDVGGVVRKINRGEDGRMSHIDA